MRVLKRIMAGCAVVVTVLLSACGSGASFAPGPRVSQPEGLMSWSRRIWMPGWMRRTQMPAVAGEER